MITVFGEVMLRISPKDKGDRLFNTQDFNIEPGGSESNVAIALSNLGNKTQIITKLPENNLKNTVLRYLNKYKININHITYSNDRIGMYWTENGVSVRSSSVIYDRVDSAFYKIKQTDFDWENIFKNSIWFHISGITPALSKNLYEVQLNSLEKAIKAKQRISFDLNLRKTLWQWVGSKKDKEQYYNNICSYADMLIGNEEDYFEALNIKNRDINFKDISIDNYNYMLTVLFKKFGKIKYIGVSLRSSIDASLNNWQGLFAVREGQKFKVYTSTVYRISNIIDRVGAGDSFAAGLIHGVSNIINNKDIIEFATAFSALKHTITGDSCDFFVEDVQNLLQSKGTGRIIR